VVLRIRSIFWIRELNGKCSERLYRFPCLSNFFDFQHFSGIFCLKIPLSLLRWDHPSRVRVLEISPRHIRPSVSSHMTDMTVPSSGRVIRHNKLSSPTQFIVSNLAEIKVTLQIIQFRDLHPQPQSESCVSLTSLEIRMRSSPRCVSPALISTDLTLQQ
jgi:hypothetical protein